jgi:hypothetical protein
MAWMAQWDSNASKLMAGTPLGPQGMTQLLAIGVYTTADLKDKQ